MASAQPAPAPAEAYGRLPAIGQAPISPDGRQLIVFTGQGEGGAVAIHRIEADSFPLVRGLNAPPGGSIRGVDFADDQFALVTISQTYDSERGAASGPSTGSRTGSGARGVSGRANAVSATEYMRQLTVDISTGATAFMLSNQRFSSLRPSLGAVTAPIEGDPGFGRAVTFDANAINIVVSVMRVNLSSGLSDGLQRGTSDTQQFCLDAAGNPYARVDYEESDRRWSIYSVNGNRSREVQSGTVADNQEYRIPSLGCRIHGQPQNIVAVGGYSEGGDRYGWRTFDLSSGAMAPLYEHETYDPGAVWDPYACEIIGYGYDGPDGEELDILDTQIRTIRERMSARLNGADFVVESWDRARSRFVVSSDIAGRGPSYLLYETATDRLRLIGCGYPEIAQTQVPERRSVTYRARDGARIPAYLTLPPGATEPRNLPLVIMPHGGPHSQNQRGFDWWAGFMASRGYAVLEPDFRGSTGYGRAWEEAGHGAWGNGVMQHDLTDGVAALVRQGIADPQRVCIVGASYGGYAALAGVAFTPDVYACAVSVAGVSDLRRMFRRELRVSGADSPTTRFWTESMGEENFDRDSPAQYVDRIRTPILLIHGAHDTVVPFDQSTWMVERMRAAGKDVRLVELAGDDHWLSDAATRTQMLREIDTFLAQHIGQPRAQ